MTSTRYEGDTWDLASSVGVTATMVAAARAVASRADRPLIDDPFAEPLVKAVGVDLLTRLATGEVDPDDLNDVHDGATGSAGAMSRMADNMAVRTKFFDEFFLGATKAGIKQVVILASGLDARAYRLAGGGRRPARRLARRVAHRRIRPDPADRLERRGPAGLPAAGGAGPPAG